VPPGPNDTPIAETLAPPTVPPTDEIGTGLPMLPTSFALLSVPGYEVLGELGRGGMGVVYKARDRALGRIVAIKMILGGVHSGEDELARFRREAQAIASLHHPHVIQIHSWGECNGLPYIVLEYIEGGNLAECLRGQAQSPLEAARLVLLLAGAVHAAHKCGIIHRDLKPSNILLAPATDDRSLKSAYGCPKISDFGLARRTDGPGNQTTPGKILGSPCYMAPEQAAGRNQDIGPATDIYALGAILYECLTGVPPFCGENMIQVLDKIRTELPKRPGALRPDVPAELETLCLKCLHKDPVGRPGSALELADSLRDWLEHFPDPTGASRSLPAMALPDSDKKREALAVSQKRLRIWALCTAGALLAAAALLAWRPWNSWSAPDPNLTPEKQEEQPLPFHDDRQAAVWALKMGGGSSARILESATNKKFGIFALEGLPKEPFLLTGLNLFGNAITDKDLARLAELKHLKDLVLGKTAVKGPGLRYLANLPGLQSLELIDTPLDDEGIRRVGELRELSQLRMNSGKFKSASLASLRQLTALRTLTLDGDLASDDIVAALGPLGITRLQLHAQGGQLSAAGVVALTQLPELRELTLDGRISAEACEETSALRNLTTLGFSMVDIGDNQVAKLRDLAGLRQLDLLNCARVTDDAVKILKGFTKLNWLNISGTAITAQGAAQLEEAFGKRCKLIYTPRTDSGATRHSSHRGQRAESERTESNRFTQGRARCSDASLRLWTRAGPTRLRAVP
jgi:serine/threonine protein kinase